MTRVVLAACFSGCALGSTKCCYSNFGDASSCGGYPSGASSGLCNNDYSHPCSGDVDCQNLPTPLPTPVPSPTPSPSPPTPPPTPSPGPTNKKCCWSNWGDATSCGGYPSQGSGGLCTTDWSKSCSGDADCPDAPVPPPTPVPPPSPPSPPVPTPPTTTTTTHSLSPDDLLGKVVQQLENADSNGVFQYQTPSGGWKPSTLYTWKDMIEGVKIMAQQGIGKQKLYIGEGANINYGLVNIAGFLGQCMKETIMYNACDENNWSNPDVTKQFGGTAYTASYACGQGKQSYQDYKCSADDDALAGGKMACDVDLDMEMRAHTQAEWYGAPPKMFCAPKSKVPKAPKWNWGGPWCPQKGGYNYKTPFPDDMTNFSSYWNYVNHAGSCRDYDGIKAGGWGFCGGAGCKNSPAPLFGHPDGRVDVEGCCWWGRGVIQTTGVCNFGKLNYFMGKRGKDEGRTVLYPDIDFCKNPEAICEPDSPPALKWIAGFFYWLNSVQSYVDKDGWVYMDKLRNWTDAGMQTADKSYINACSGIVNRGCYNPPCGGNPMDGGAQRAANFATVLKAMKIGAQFEEDHVEWV